MTNFSFNRYKTWLLHVAHLFPGMHNNGLAMLHSILDSDLLSLDALKLSNQSVQRVRMLFIYNFKGAVNLC